MDRLQSAGKGRPLFRGICSVSSFVLLCAAALAGCDSGHSDAAAAPAPVQPAPPPPNPPAPPPPTPDPPPPTPDPPPPPVSDSIPPLADAIAIDGGDQIGADHWPDGDTSVGGLGQEVMGLPCGHMDETYHVHAHLSIILNGDPLALPANIGIVEQSATSQCYYSLHTHDSTGKIHIEAPEPRSFTLGQFFAIWGEPLGRDNVAGMPGLPVTVYVVEDGAATEYTDDLAALELESHRDITIQIGTPITEIPTFTWNGL
jgi:hypothetical protein